MIDCGARSPRRRREGERRYDLLDGSAQGGVRSVNPDDARDYGCVAEEKNLDTRLQLAVNGRILQHACGRGVKSGGLADTKCRIAGLTSRKRAGTAAIQRRIDVCLGEDACRTRRQGSDGVADIGWGPHAAPEQGPEFVLQLIALEETGSSAALHCRLHALDVGPHHTAQQLRRHRWDETHPALLASASVEPRHGTHRRGAKESSVGAAGRNL